VREKRCCVAARNGRHGMVEVKLLCFKWLSPFFKCVQERFQDLLKVTPHYLSRDDHNSQIRAILLPKYEIKVWNQLLAQALATFRSKLHVVRKRVRKVIISEK
jgi:hypothetical protein